MQILKLSVGFRALLAQGMAGFISFQIIGLMTGAHATFDLNDATWLIVGIHSSLAVLISMVLRLPRWWLFIQAIFVPAVVLAFNLGIAPVSYLLAFIIFWLIFRDNTVERVPLYLSSSETWRTVAEQIPRDKPIRFLDVGCGLGGGIRMLAEQYPESEFHGIESAPLPYLYARFMARDIPNCHVHLGNFRDMSLRNYEMVYAFLSPQPMPSLWCKVRREMRPGTRFISNTFTIPDFEPDQIIPVEDRAGSRLLFWNL